MNRPLLENEAPRSTGEAYSGSSGGDLPQHPHSQWMQYAIFALVLLLFAGARFRLRSIPLERDEGEFAYMGQLMLQNIAPYKLAANMKLPGTYAAYAVIMAVLGQTPCGIHIGLMLVNAATSVFVFMLGKRLYGTLCGVVAGCSYALLSARLSVLGFSAHATHFVIFFALAGVLVYLYAADSGRMRWIFLSGLLLGAAFIMKQPGILFVLFVFLDLIRRQWRERANFKRIAQTQALFAVGAALPFALTCLVLLFAGLFHAFWFWTFTYARAYGSLISFSTGLKTLAQIMVASIARPRALWTVAALALPLLVWSKPARSHAAFVTGFALFSALAVFPGFYFRPHYFIVVLPSVSILSGVFVVTTTQFLQQHKITFLPPSLPAVLALVFLVIYLFGQKKILFKMSPLEISRSEYPGEAFIGAVRAADFIKANVPENETIAVLGSEPEIPFYSHRHSASMYLYTRPLLEAQPYSQWMQHQYVQQIEAAHPAALIDVDERWFPDQKPQPVLAWMKEYESRDYELARQFPFDGGGPDNSLRISVYLRKQNPAKAARP